MARNDAFGLQWMNLPAICQLAARRQWVCWRRQSRKGKETKVPFQPNGKPASSVAPETWNEMPTCFTEVVAGRFDGLGYVLAPDDEKVCIDLDHCIRADGTLEPWAEAIVREANSYTERSPNDGLHIWVKAHVTFSGRRSERVEVYNTGRYITVTSQHWPGTPETIEERTGFVEKLVADMGEPELPPAFTQGQARFEIDPTAQPPVGKFAALFSNDPKFKGSWEQNRRDLKDASLSSLDMSLATIAAYAEWTDQEIVNLIIAHRRERGSPDKGLRHDYLERTLRSARIAVAQRLKDFEAARVHNSQEIRMTPIEETLAEISTLLSIDVRRVIQRGLDPAFYSIEACFQGEVREIHIGGGEVLMSQTKTRVRIMESAGLIVPKLTSKEWERLLAQLIRIREIEDLAEGQRDREVWSWLSGYLGAGGAVLQAPETGAELHQTIASGVFPIRWNESVYLRTQDLKTFIFREMGERYSTSVICANLRSIGAESTVLSARSGRNVISSRVWMLPPSILENENLYSQERASEEDGV